jgi:hypothetical protein
MSHTQTLAPNSIRSEANYFPHVTTADDIDDDPDSPDDLYGRWDGLGNTVLAMGFPAPSSPPMIGTGLQLFKVLIRRNGDTENADWVLDLMEFVAGILQFREVLATGTLTNTTPIVVSGIWDASLLADATGASVVVRLRQSFGGTSSPRSGVECAPYGGDPRTSRKQQQLLSSSSSSSVGS